MIVTRTTVGPFQENAYFVADEATGHAVFIDPGADGERLADVVRRSGATLDAIWLTHAHVDHVGGIAGLRRRYDVPIFMHPLDAPVYAAAPAVAAAYGVPFDSPPPVDRALADGQTVIVGQVGFEVLHTPGHAPGHVIFVGRDLVFGGDLLFLDSIGRTDLPLSDPAAMAESLARAAGLAEDLVVHPGHGPSTSIGRELRHNPFLTGVARVAHSGTK
jgi:hydroxyacylglutathione hydrolase